jgi:hypothetical protein
MKKLIKITFPILLVVGIYFLGPSPDRPVYDTSLPQVPSDPTSLEQYIQAS